MNLSTLLQPPKAPPEPPASDRDARPRARERVRQRGRRYRRAFALGLIASAIAHLLVLVISPLFIRYVESVGPIPAPPPRSVRAAPSGTQVVEIRVTETPEPERPREVEEEPAPVAAAPEPAAPTAEEADVEEEAVPTAAERLRPRVGDWRLWVSPPLATRELTPAERDALLRARIYARIEAYNDSAAADAARRAAALDWTVGEEGNRWGVSPGKIHLGPITLPLPFGLEPHPAVQRDQAREQAEWEAIQRQAGQGAIDEVFEDRIRAIRERRERERAREKAEDDTTSNR